MEFITWVGENQSSDYGAHLANILKNHPDAVQKWISTQPASQQKEIVDFLKKEN